MMHRSSYGHGKCVLTGEHGVLRGVPAIVWPLPTYGVSAELIPESTQIQAQTPAGEKIILKEAEALREFYQTVFGKAMPGVRLDVRMPLGMGLGGSAAISVALARLWASQDVFRVAHQLEHIFHGSSSGLDVVGAMAEGPVFYQMASSLQVPLALSWKPLLFLSSTGIQSSTREAVDQVRRLRDEDLSFAQELDEAMGRATALVRAGLERPEGMESLAQGLGLARGCFEAWGLVTEAMATQMNLLQESGAVAVKPTGAGLGGYVLSLWSNPPPSNLPLVPLGRSE